MDVSHNEQNEHPELIIYKSLLVLSTRSFIFNSFGSISAANTMDSRMQWRAGIVRVRERRHANVCVFENAMTTHGIATIRFAFCTNTDEFNQSISWKLVLFRVFYALRWCSPKKKKRRRDILLFRLICKCGRQEVPSDNPRHRMWSVCWESYTGISPRSTEIRMSNEAV